MTDPTLLALRVAQVARVTSLPRRSVYALVETGELPHVRIGERILILVADLEAFLSERRMGGVPPAAASARAGPPGRPAGQRLRRPEHRAENCEE